MSCPNSQFSHFENYFCVQYKNKMDYFYTAATIMFLAIASMMLVCYLIYKTRMKMKNMIKWDIYTPTINQTYSIIDLDI